MIKTKFFFPFLFILTVSLAFGIFFSLARAQETGGGGPATSEEMEYGGGEEVESDYCYACPGFDHYEAVGSCGGVVQEWWSEPCCSGDTWVKNTIQCGQAQLPNASSASCDCSANECYPPPQPKDVKDDTLSPKNVFENPSALKLPVNLGWNDLYNEWVKPNSIPAGECKVEAYNYEIRDSSGAKRTGKSILSPSADPVLSAVPEQCILSPSAQYQWQVQACQDEKGQDCSVWSEQKTFQTSSAPELKSPYDPDWEGKESGRAAFPTKFAWCEHPDSSVKSYAFNAYEAKEDGSKGAQVLLAGTSSRGKTTYSDSSLLGGLNRLGKGATYFWEIAACTDSGAKQCGILSQLWKLVPGGELKAPTALSPLSGSFVNMTDVLQWQQVVFATHYVVRIQGGSISKDFFTQGMLSLQTIWQELALTTAYTWKVAPCGGLPISTDVDDCKNDNGTIPWSKEQKFTTTGAQPKNLTVTPTEKGVAGIPLTLNWDDANGAASYEITVSQSSTPRIVSEKSETMLQYPALKTKTSYSWTVKTCADKLAKKCGPEASGSFTTVTLASPPLSDPPLGQKEFDPYTAVVWYKVFSGNFYSYTLTFLSPSPQEASPECKKTYEAAHQIIAENGATVRFRCLGNYTLSVQACIDENCKELGGATVLPLAVEKLLARTGGLVPCDRGNDNLSTPWDERKECGLGGVFLLVRNLIDFVLWKLTLIIVVLMAAATGAIMFFSFGGPDIIAKVRSIWKSVGIGVLILLFSWLFLNILLGLVGFNVNVFGHWYDLPI